jgi:lysophospholipase L1-like esterase
VIASAWACASANAPPRGTTPGFADAAGGSEASGSEDAANGVGSSGVGSSGAPASSGTDAAASGGGAADGAAPDATSLGGGATDSVTGQATIHFLGRFDTRDSAGPRFGWPGSAIAASFSGTGIKVTLTDGGTNYFAVVIDGGAPTTLSTMGSNKTYALASNLASGHHTLVLTKRTESNVGVVQFLGLAPQGGSLVASPDPFTRRIEYVGDSITCGYGNLGMGPSCSFSASTEDETVAYGALTASQLNAQQTVVAYSGKGMYRNNDGTTTSTMPVLFGRTLADDSTSVWGFSTPPPDIVVINLSTNDFAKGDPGTAFQQAYVTFLQQLRTHYASAEVLCTLSPMLSGTDRSASLGYIQGAVQQVRGAGDTKVSFVAIPDDGGTTSIFDVQQASDGYGCDYHPTTKTHQVMATELVPTMHTMMGW